MSEAEDYEYAYSSDEDGVLMDGDDNEDDSNSNNVVGSDDDDDNSQNRSRHIMDWEKSNPNAAPTMMTGGSSSHARQHHHHHHHNHHHHHPSYKCGIRILDSKELFPEMNKRIKALTEVLGVTPAAASVLLREYHYSKEDLLEQYMVDSDQVLKQCGVYHRVASPKPPKLPPKRDDAVCPICYEEMELSHCMSMPCGHTFCLDCWSDFCINAIAEGPSCVATTCPEASCNERVTQEEFTKALGGDTNNNNNNNNNNGDSANPGGATTIQEEPVQLVKYTEFLLRNFVESNPLTRWCPGKGCERVACAESTAAMESENNLAHCTKCSTRFCMVCGCEPHAPVSCKHLLTWTEKCRNESETANWILANTKSCPKCVSRIEKNQGCNHMTCQRCKFEFCWICMGDWKDHGANTGGYYKCSRYRESEDPTSDSARAKRELDRYLHYYRRFHAHQEAEKFAQKQLTETEQRMVALQEASGDAKWTDVEFLKTANIQLVECRRVLKYTYVFAYYLPSVPTAARDRFEHHQEMLERFTENLSELSEKPIADMDRTDVVNQTRVVDRFMKNILKYVEDGMEEE